jgi:adenylosuccinate lyase
MNESPQMPLHALSPLDGRYAAESAPLGDYFSEFAYLRQRVRVETEYLMALAHETRLVRAFTSAEDQFLRTLAADFSLPGAQEIKRLEQATRHDVKAIEYFLRDQLASTSLADVVEWLHFGLTSEDVNQTAQALALRDSREAVMLPALDAIIARLAELARQHARTPMLARTHGQPAVPTTFGKELAVFMVRLSKQRALLRAHRFESKIAGAIGNFNALNAAAPQVDWLAFSEGFIRRLGLDPNLHVTQLVPYDNWIRYFDLLHLTNSILIDAAQDLWRYISDDYVSQRVVAGEVGSSTMPQKVNPIDFENAEGNLGLANALFNHYAQKLPVTRLQRDLSDSTVRRTFGVALGHSLVAYLNFARGLERIQPNEVRMREELNAHWEVVAEGAQTILRSAGVANAYEVLKSLTRGKAIGEPEYLSWVTQLSMDDSIKAQLRALSPLTYIGLAEALVECALTADY